MEQLICVQSASVATFSSAPGDDKGQCKCEKWTSVCHAVTFVTSARNVEQHIERHANTTVVKISSGWLHKHHCLGRTRFGAMKGCYFGKRRYVKSGRKLLGLQIDRAEVWRRFRLH